MSLLQKLANLANEADKAGLLLVASRLDKILVKSASFNADFMETQKLLNKYRNDLLLIKSRNFTEDELDSEELKSLRTPIPENGNVADKAAYDFVKFHFGKLPGRDYKNYKQLLEIANSVSARIDQLNADIKQKNEQTKHENSQWKQTDISLHAPFVGSPNSSQINSKSDITNDDLEQAGIREKEMEFSQKELEDAGII